MNLILDVCDFLNEVLAGAVLPHADGNNPFAHWWANEVASSFCTCSTLSDLDFACASAYLNNGRTIDRLINLLLNLINITVTFYVHLLTWISKFEPVLGLLWGQTEQLLIKKGPILGFEPEPPW